MGCIHPLEVAGVIVAPVPTSLSSCQQLRFIYIHFFQFVPVHCQLEATADWFVRSPFLSDYVFFFFTYYSLMDCAESYTIT